MPGVFANCSASKRTRCAFAVWFSFLSIGIGQTWTQSSAPSNLWHSVASSRDGTRLVAGANFGPLYTSGDSGATWIATSAPTNYWQTTASSADGIRLIGLADKLYVSTNSGTNWTANAMPSVPLWGALASSDDGTRLVAVAIYDPGQRPGRVYVSSDTGVTWTATSAPSNNWYGVASSADGTRIVATGGYAAYVSTNSGASWTAAAIPNNGWTAAASSSDGAVLVVAGGGMTYASTNGGASWNNLFPPAYVTDVAMSRDGRLFMAVGPTGIYLSPDSGRTWGKTDAPAGNWLSVAASGDGSKWVAAISGSGIYNLAITNPVVLLQPSDLVVPAGLDAVFTASVAGTEPLSLQWTRSGTNLLGATNLVLTLTNVDFSMAGQYALIVSNQYNSISSSNVELKVVSALVDTLSALPTATGATVMAQATASKFSSLWFEWGLDTNYGNRTPGTGLPQGTWQTSSTIDNLNGELIYHYRAAVSNEFGITFGLDRTFEPGLAPTAQTLFPTGLTTNSATLRASINPQGRQTAAYLRWGVAPLESNVTPLLALGQGASSLRLSNSLSGLQPFTLYQCSVLASNSAGSVTGAPIRFITGPWFPIADPDVHWQRIACSADGSTLIGTASGGGIYTSTDRGASWVSNSVVATNWSCVTSSADGGKLAVAYGGASVSGQAYGAIYTSTNSGTNWNLSGAPAKNWSAIASSADGAKLFAAAESGGIRPGVLYASTNAGVNWTSNYPAVQDLFAVACSADGSRIIAATSFERVYLSSDSGKTWNAANLPVTNWNSVACSADGQTFIAAGGLELKGPIYVSTNSGVSWNQSRFAPTYWASVACSADGQKLVAVGSGAICVSANRGLNWVTNVQSLAWATATCTADGNTLFAVAAGQIYRLQSTASPLLTITRSGSVADLSWIVPSTPFTLEQVSDAQGTNWIDTPLLPRIDFNTLRYRVPISPDTPASFYRLRH